MNEVAGLGARSSRLIDFRITALRQIAGRHAVESPIAVRGQNRTFNNARKRTAQWSSYWDILNVSL